MCGVHVRRIRLNYFFCFIRIHLSLSFAFDVCSVLAPSKRPSGTFENYPSIQVLQGKRSEKKNENNINNAKQCDLACDLHGMRPPVGHIAHGSERSGPPHWTETRGEGGGGGGAGMMLAQNRDSKSSRNYSNFERINCGCLGGRRK